MEAEIVYLYEKMEDHLFQVVRSSGQVVDEVDIITAEGIANRLDKRGFNVQWVDRNPSKERKHVRSLISQFSSRNVIPARSSVGVSLQY